MTRIQTFRLVIMAAVLSNYVGEGLAQSDVNEIVRSQITGDDFHIFVDPHALELFGDSVITSLNSDGDETWNTWKDVLSNGNSPGMDVNFDGWNAYGIDSLLIQGAAKLDSTLEVDGYVRMNDGLYVAMYALFQSKLSIGDSLVVAGGTALNSTLDVAGDLAAASALTVTGKTKLNDSLVVNGNVVFNASSSIIMSVSDPEGGESEWIDNVNGAFIGLIDSLPYTGEGPDFRHVALIEGLDEALMTVDGVAGIDMWRDGKEMFLWADSMMYIWTDYMMEFETDYKMSFYADSKMEFETDSIMYFETDSMMKFFADSMIFEEGDVRMENSLEVSGTIAANGLQIAAIERTATSDGAGDGRIAPGTSFVSVTSAHPDSIITLPPPVPGSTVSLYCADPYTLETSDPTSISILDVGGLFEVDEDLLLRCTCVSSTKWIVWSHPGEAP